MKRYVIIGNGTAGASAVEQIRKRDQQGSIKVFTCEKYPYYYRPRLPEYISGDSNLDKFTLHPLSKYEEWNVELHLGEPVTAIDPEKKEVTSRRKLLPKNQKNFPMMSSCFQQVQTVIALR